jgi:plasmid stability protein
MKTKEKKSTIYFDAGLHKALRLKAAETDRSVTQIVNEAVRLILAEDAEDIAVFEQRSHEPNLSFEAALKDLKKRGKI